MANASIFAAFERLWQHIVVAINAKNDELKEYVGAIPEDASAVSVIGYVDEKVSNLDGITPASHTHMISDVENLQEELDKKSKVTIVRWE